MAHPVGLTRWLVSLVSLASWASWASLNGWLVGLVNRPLGSVACQAGPLGANQALAARRQKALAARLGAAVHKLTLGFGLLLDVQRVVDPRLDCFYGVLHFHPCVDQRSLRPRGLLGQLCQASVFAQLVQLLDCLGVGPDAVRVLGAASLGVLDRHLAQVPAVDLAVPGRAAVLADELGRPLGPALRATREVDCQQVLACTLAADFCRAAARNRDFFVFLADVALYVFCFVCFVCFVCFAGFVGLAGLVLSSFATCRACRRGRLTGLCWLGWIGWLGRRLCWFG